MSLGTTSLDFIEVAEFVSEKLDGLNESQRKRAEELGIPVVSEDSTVLGQNHIAERIRWAEKMMQEIDSIFNKYTWDIKSNNNDEGFVIKDATKRIGILPDIQEFYNRNKGEWDRIDGIPYYAHTDKERREYAAMIPLIKFYQAFPELAYDNIGKIESSKRSDRETFMAIIKIYQNCTRFLSKESQESYLQLVLTRTEYHPTNTEITEYYSQVAEKNPESDFSVFCFDGLEPDNPTSITHLEELFVTLDGNPDEFIGKIKVPTRLALGFIRKHFDLFHVALNTEFDRSSVVYWFSKVCPPWRALLQKIISEGNASETKTTKAKKNLPRKKGSVPGVLGSTGAIGENIVLQEISHDHIRLGGFHPEMQVGLRIRELGTDMAHSYEVSEKNNDGFDLGSVITLDGNKEYEVRVIVDGTIVGDGSWTKIKSPSLDYVRRHSPVIKEVFLKNIHTQSANWGQAISIPSGAPEDSCVYITREDAGAGERLDLSHAIDLNKHPPGRYYISLGFDTYLANVQKERLIIPTKQVGDVESSTGKRVDRTVSIERTDLKNPGRQPTAPGNTDLSMPEDHTDDLCLSLLDHLDSFQVEKLGSRGYILSCALGEHGTVTFVMDESGQLSYTYDGTKNIEKARVLAELGEEIKTKFTEFKEAERSEEIERQLGYFVGIEGFLSAALRGIASLEKQEKNLIDAVPGDVRGTLGNLYINNRYYSGLKLLVQKGIIDGFISECKNQGVHIKIVRSNDSGVEDAKGTELSISISIAGEQGIAGTLLTKQNTYPVISQRGDIESKIYERLQDLLLNIVYLLGKVGMLSHSQGVTEYKGKKITDAEIRDILAGKCGFPKHQEWKVMEKVEKEEIRELYARFQKGFGKKVIKEGFGVSTGYYEYTITGRHDISGIADDDTIVVRDERIQGVKEGDTSRWNPDIYTVLEKNQRLRIALIYRMRATVDGGAFERKSKLTNGMKSCFDNYWAGLDTEVRDDFLKSFDKKRGGDGMKGIEFINPRTGEKIIDEFIGLLRDTNEKVLSLTDGGVYVKHGQVPLRYNSPYTISGSAFREYIKNMKEEEGKK